VDARPGAATIVGTEIAARAVPDGYTLLMITTTFAINPGLYAKLPYDPVRDFSPVTQLNSQPNIVVVNPSLAARSVKDLIALGKAKPGELTFATEGPEEGAEGVEALHPRVGGVGDDEGTVGGHGHRGGVAQLPGTGSAGAPFPHEDTGGSEFLHVITGGVGDVHVAVGADDGGSGVDQPAVGRSGRNRAPAADALPGALFMNLSAN